MPTMLNRATPINQGYGLNSGLVDWWLALPGVQGNTWYNLRSQRHGALTNAPTWATGMRAGGSALRFNGNNSHVVTSVIPAASGTLSLWARPARAFNSGVDEHFLKAGFDPGFGMRHFSDNNFYCGFERSGNDDRVIVAASAANWVQNSWQNYALAWVSGGDTKLYRNGVQIGPTVTATNSGIAGQTVFIGSNHAGTAAFSGDLDDVRVWNRALSAGELLSAYADAMQGYPLTLNRIRR